MTALALVVTRALANNGQVAGIRVWRRNRRQEPLISRLFPRKARTAIGRFRLSSERSFMAYRTLRDGETLLIEGNLCEVVN